MQYEDTSEWLTQGSSQDFESMKMVKVEGTCVTAVGGKKTCPSICPLKKRKPPDSCLNAISQAFVVEMRCDGGH